MKKHIAWLCKFLSISFMVMLVSSLLNAAVTDSWKSTDFGGSPGEFASVIFLDENTLVGGTPGYYNLNEGALYISSNGGTTWSKKAEGKANISKVRNAPGTQIVYAVGGAEGYGYEGFLGKSTDGGSSWSDLSENFFEARKTILKLDTANSFPLYGLCVLDANTLFISGGYGSGDPAVWVSTDGGSSWAEAGIIDLDWTAGSETGYLSHGTMQFVSTTAGFAASENNFFRTTDGGATWVKLSAPWSLKINDGNNLGTLTFLDAENGWVLIYDSTISSSSPTYGTEIYKTDNGGTTWALVYKWSFTSSQNEDSPLAFYTDNGVEMWVGSWHKIWHSTDSGNSWTIEYDNASDGYVCVRSFKPAGNDPVPRAMYSIGMTGSYISGYYTRVGESTITTTTIPSSATTTTIPSGETTTTTIINTTTTTTKPGGGQCPAKTVMGQDNPDLKTLRAFRKEMFIQSADGKRYTTLYYKHASELVDIFSHDKALSGKAGRLIQKIIPVIGYVLAKKEAAIGEDTVQQAIELLDALITQANSGLEKDLQQLKQDIQNGILFNTVKVKIQK